MAPYTRRWRRRWRWRWPGRRTNRWRTGYKNRRFWKTRRSQKRRKRRRVKFGRKRRLVTLFDPISKKKCVITGQTIGLIARGFNVVNRCWRTMWKDRQITKLLTGGGVSLMTFSLKFLWDEHRHYRNVWSATNDGFDLALYFGTKVYLKPHETKDYVFFWDTDLVDEKEWDYMRLHPSNLLATKNAVFVRSQLSHNFRTKKVYIRPPANITTQWKFQYQWYDYPLFQYAFVLFNWKEPYLKQDVNQIPVVRVGDKVFKWSGSDYVTNSFGYSPLIDTGNGNYIEINYFDANISKPPAEPGTWQRVEWAKDLPYWLTFWGQNTDFNFNVPRPNTAAPTNIPWIRFGWPAYSDTDIINGTLGKPQSEWVMPASGCRTIASMGPYVQDSLRERLNIPFMYKSFWKWGGTVLKHDNIVAIQPTSGQVSVKNPQTQIRDIIYPFDQSGGLLTERALKRFLEPSTTIDERRALPSAPDTQGYVSEESYDETGSEAEESEEIKDCELEVGSTLKALTRKLQREQSKRRRFNKFLKSLLRKPGQFIIE